MVREGVVSFTESQLSCIELFWVLLSVGIDDPVGLIEYLYHGELFPFTVLQFFRCGEVALVSVH